MFIEINMVITTSGACAIKAGANVSTAIPDTNGWVPWVSGAIAEVNVATRHNWNDDYDTLDDDVKHIISKAVTNLASISAIQYDMSGYTSRGEAESMVNILRDEYLRCISILRDIKAQTFLGV